ncbi:MAG: ABC transporter ATP-binding protein/permease [Actinomycetota bacterium]|nr:ABC transporter ATP-binding protein/permease [Actinomycetota bacterium]
MANIPDFVSRSTTAFRKCLVLLGPRARGKWLTLVGLAVFVSALEALAAVFVFVLLALVTNPQGPIMVPLLGDLHQRFPRLTEPRTLLAAALITAGFFLVRALVYLLQSYLQNRLAYGTAASLARRLVRGYLAMPYSQYLRRNSAEMIRNAHESTVGFAQLVLFPGIVLGAEIFVTLTLCAMLVLTSPLAALAAFLLLGCVVLLMLRLVQPRLLRLGRRVQDFSTESLKSLQQTLHGLRDIRVLGREGFFEESFAATRQSLADAYAARGLLIDIPRVTLETSVLLVVLLFLGAQAIRTGSVAESVTALGLFGYAAFRILPSVNRIVNNVQSLKFAGPLIDFLHEDVVAADAALAEVNAPRDDSFHDTIEMKDVGFRYPGADRDAVAGIQLTIRRGESIGIAGPTGSGKSTLLDLILGLLEPTAGEIYIDGQPLHQEVRTWQRCVGVVPQMIFLLDDTIRRNIAFGLVDGEIDEVRVEEAVKIAQLESFVEALPSGLDTIVGERGVKLSGGQRQRLAIARAMYRQPEVLIFDEGTSALDSRTEADVINALPRMRPDLTLISVAHRLSTIRNHDRVVFVTDGQIAAVGSFDDLVKQSDDFRAMAQQDPTLYARPT